MFKLKLGKTKDRQIRRKQALTLSVALIRNSFAISAYTCDQLHRRSMELVQLDL